MIVCSLCENVSHEAALVFHNVRDGERVSLEVALCERCGARIEKHLKRAIPKRIMQVSPARSLDRTPRAGRREQAAEHGQSRR